MVSSLRLRGQGPRHRDSSPRARAAGLAADDAAGHGASLQVYRMRIPMRCAVAMSLMRWFTRGRVGLVAHAPVSASASGLGSGLPASDWRMTASAPASVNAAMRSPITSARTSTGAISV